MFVKVCGITRLEDALHAARCGASALGFVFWPRSPRAIDVDRAAAIVRDVPGEVMTVGVFVNQPVAEVADIAARVGLRDVAQADAVGRAVAEDVAHRGRQVAHGQDDVVDAVVLEPLEHVGEEGAIDERDDRLGHGGGQRPQPRALAADEDDCLHAPDGAGDGRPMPS